MIGAVSSAELGSDKPGIPEDEGGRKGGIDRDSRSMDVKFTTSKKQSIEF
jgi:hypothetical protein